jgi:pimeloyl-ACP methyl ester carboxylesterase
MWGKVDWALKLTRVAFRLGQVAPNATGKLAHRLFVTPRGSRGRSRSDLFASAKPFTIEGMPLPMKLYGFGEGPRALLVHGWESRSEKFASLVEPLVQRGYQAIAVDAHAHGAAPGARLPFGVACRAMAQLLDALTPEIVIAHSYGAATVAYGLAHAQKKFPVRVVSLAAIVEAKQISETYLRLTRAPQSLKAPFYRELASSWGKPVEFFSMPNFARRLDCPALLVHDRWDPVIPYAHGKALHEAWRGSQLLTTSELGHHNLLKDEKVLAEVLRFACSTENVGVASER